MSASAALIMACSPTTVTVEPPWESSARLSHSVVHGTPASLQSASPVAESYWTPLRSPDADTPARLPRGCGRPVEQVLLPLGGRRGRRAVPLLAGWLSRLGTWGMTSACIHSRADVGRYTDSAGCLVIRSAQLSSCATVVGAAGRAWRSPDIARPDYSAFMPEQRYEAARRTIGTLLSTTSPHIEVPEWQRSYSWTTEQVEAFWLDLLAFDERYPGDNIVGEEYFLGSIVLVTGGETDLLLDGQQRLATATIMLSALRDARRQFLADAATRLQNKYISDFDDATGATNNVLTLNVYDRGFFQAEVQDEPKNPPVKAAATLRSHGLIRKARQYFIDQIAAESAASGGGQAAFQRNLRLGRVLCDHMSVVAVTSSDSDNAAEVFETLNDRGIGLSTPDLLRNLLLRRAPDDATRTRIVSAWQTVLSTNEEASVEDFLRHYWISRRGDVKARSLYREIKTTITQEKIDSLTLSLELAEAAPLYRDLVRGREEDPELRRQLLAIRELAGKSLYPVLLAGYAVAGDDKEEQPRLRALAQSLVTLIVRYNVIGGRETTVMESTLYGAAAALRNTGDFEAAIATFAALAPDAADFVSRFRRASVPRVATARYLLREIEHAKRRTEEVAVEGTDRVHVEHIYPQTPLLKWANHSAVVNRLGNLTLLGRRLNTSIKNSDFATKKEKGYAPSDLLLTKELLIFDDWNATLVDIRQWKLSEWVFDIWKFPGEQAPTDKSAEIASKKAPSVVQDDSESPDSLPEVPQD